ncbi:hypothetical protein BFJ69_g17947 [Fusarium oxysporum]|uniref:Uncharacterized protein n=1 Tax=Fusarium oxysporum TaxID=5507 RepID=A0A420M6R9_FUSOX|nr:hypothetical protein BFJ69_g17947 [Fusarium oxysporum]
MTSLCNISHPELQITDGLIRQETGRLFPYNPEFYDNATGLYGPGAIYCWYMLLASVFASWFYCRPDHDGFMKPGISSDLLGALAYPVFAATDLLVQSIRMLGMDHRAEVIYCLRYPTADQLDSSGSPNTTQIDLNHIPADVLELGQHVVDIIGPLTVCCTATTIPDLGIRVTERDQLATLIVGIFTLAYTIFDIWQNFYRQKDKVQVAEEEMQMLPSAEA